MSSTTSKLTVNTNDLPEDIFSYNNEKFYEFIKQKYGDDLAELFSFQAIRNGSHLLDISCDEIFMIFQQESNDTDKLKKLCCIQVGDNKYEVKLGVKLAVKRFVELLKMKEKQQKKNKRSSTRPSSSILINPTSIDQTQSQTSLPSSPSTLLSSLENDTLPTGKLTSDQKNFNEMDHKADIERRINAWCSEINIDQDTDSSLDEGTHYFLEINKSLNDTYACILTCQCRIRFKLSFSKPGYFFKISSFYRNVKERQCMKRLKMKHNKQNATIIDENSVASESDTSNRSSKAADTAAKNKPTSTQSVPKRFRSPSTQTSSKTVDMMTKKKRPLGTNNTDAAQQ